MLKYRWFPFDAVDWRNSFFIRSLSRAQTGAYVSLLVELWLEKNCSLPSDRMALKKLAQWDQKLTLLDPVIQHLIPHPDGSGRLTDERLYQEWLKSHHVSMAHQKAARKRWEKLPNSQTPLLTRSRINRTTKGFEPVSSEIHNLADKWLPPT